MKSAKAKPKKRKKKTAPLRAYGDAVMLEMARRYLAGKIKMPIYQKLNLGPYLP